MNYSFIIETNNSSLKAFSAWMSKLAISIYIALFDEKRWLISRKVKMVLKLLEYIVDYMLLKYMFIAGLILTEIIFRNKQIHISYSLKLIGGPSCYSKEQMLINTTLIATYCFFVVKQYYRLSKQVHNCELYHQIVDINHYNESYTNCLSLHLDTLKALSLSSYKKCRELFKKKTLELINMSYISQVLRYQSLQHNLKSTIPKYATTEYRQVLLSKVVLTIAYAYPNSLLFAYIMLFNKEDYNNYTRQYITKREPSFDNRNRAMFQLTDEKCYFSSFELILIFLIAFSPTHIFHSFCVLIHYIYLKEFKEKKELLDRYMDAIDSINLEDDEKNTVSDNMKIRLINSVSKVRQIEYFLLEMILWLESLQTRYKHPIRLINCMASYLMAFLLLAGLILFTYKTFGLVGNSALSYIVSIASFSNIFFYDLQSLQQNLP